MELSAHFWKSVRQAHTNKDDMNYDWTKNYLMGQTKLEWGGNNDVGWTLLGQVEFGSGELRHASSHS